MNRLLESGGQSIGASASASVLPINIQSWYPLGLIDGFDLLVVQGTLESPLDSKIKPVHPTGNQLWIFIGRTDAEAPILQLPDLNSQLVGKDPDAGRDWWQEKKRVTEDEMVGWHHWLNGHESGQTLGDGEGQGSLAFCSPRGCKELDTTNQTTTMRQLWPQPNSIILT